MERYIQVAQTQAQTQATARLVIVLVTRTQKSGTGDNNCQMETDILVRNDQTGQSGPPSKLLTNIPVRQN